MRRAFRLFGSFVRVLLVEESDMLSGGGFPRVSVGVPQQAPTLRLLGDCRDPSSAAVALDGASAGDAGSPRTCCWFLGCRDRSRNILCFLFRDKS